MPQLSPRVVNLMRPELKELEPYDPDFTPCQVNLSANENDYDMPSQVRAAVDEALAATPTNRYPDAMSNDLRDAIASWHGVGRENVFVGNGGDEVLFDFFLAFGGQGHTLVSCPPTFSVYDIYSSMVGTSVRNVWRDPESFEVDVDALVDASTDAAMVVVTSPNNPTGDLFPLDATRRLCEACPGLVMIDEAYGEYAREGSSAESLLSTYDNLVVLHTFSKAYCLAGVRAGYLLGAADVVDALAAVRQPYSVNVLTQAACSVVVERRDEFLPAIEKTRLERTRLLSVLGEMSKSRPIRVWPSEANYLLVRVPNASQVRARLRDEWSILVRNFSSTPGLAGCLRITVGMPEENDRLLCALEAIVKEEE